MERHGESCVFHDAEGNIDNDIYNIGSDITQSSGNEQYFVNAHVRHREIYIEQYNYM
jgi:hypothetical protein